MILFELFITFFYIGATTFGGGYAMIPLVRDEVVPRWLSDAEFINMIAVAEATPGPVAINMATFIGSSEAGILGSALATLGVVLPSLFVISVISYFFKEFLAFKVVKYAFMGIRAGVLALIVKAAKKMASACPKNIVAYIIVAASFILTAVFDINVFIVIIASAVAGLIYSLVHDKRKEEKK